MLAIAWIVSAILASVSPVRAASPPAFPNGVGAIIQHVTQSSTNHGGQVNATTIDAAFVTSHDRITVYDGGSDMRRSDQWWTATDFTDDTWVFDVGANGSAQLIIQFHVDGGHDVADLWDDVNNDGAVSYHVSNGRVDITESKFPTLQVVSSGRWFRPDGSVNYNLTWTLDGCGSCSAIPPSLRSQFASLFRHNGTPDYRGGVQDSNNDGIPDDVYSVMLAHVPASYGIQRSSVLENPDEHRPSDPSGYVFWPFLSGPKTVRGQRYWETPPYFSVDWNHAKIAGGARLSGYPTENGLHINSLSQWQTNTINNVSFENPMAYYDLANDHDGNPELHIRVEYYPPNDPYASIGANTAAEDVRYSWNQSNQPGLTWDYKLGMAGTHSVDNVQQVGPYRFRSVPYQQLPDWVMNHTWDWETFVASETDTYHGSEGIYEWSTLDGVTVKQGTNTLNPAVAVAGSAQVQRSYLTGKSADSPSSLYANIRQGLRGEFAPGPDLHPMLYFSPVDGRLHLLGVDHGVYNVDGTTRVLYADLSGEGHIDSWEIDKGATQVARLIQVPGGLLYSDGTSVSLLNTQIPEEAFRAPPPTDHASWQALDKQLKSHAKNVAADDLSAMFNQFSGKRVTISGGTLSDFRLTGDGYRFILNLQSGYNLGGLTISGVNAPGAYAVTYHTADGSFSAQSATPADPSFTTMTAPTYATSLAAITVSATVSNHGQIDLTQVPAIVTAKRQGSKRVLVKQQVVDLLAGEPVTIQGTWQPPSAGRWAITSTLYLPGGKQLSRTEDVSVAATTRPSWTSVIRGAWPNTSALGYLGLLVGLTGFSLAGGIFMVRQWR